MVHGADSRRQDRGEGVALLRRGARQPAGHRRRERARQLAQHRHHPHRANPTRDCASLAVDAPPATWPARGPARRFGMCGARRGRSGAPQRQRHRDRERQHQRNGTGGRARGVRAPVAAGERRAATVGCAREPERARLGRVQGRRELDVRRRAAVAHRSLRRAERGRRPDDVLPDDQQRRGARIPRDLATRGQGRARARQPQRAPLPRRPDRLHVGQAAADPGRGARRSDQLHRPAHAAKNRLDRSLTLRRRRLRSAGHRAVLREPRRPERDDRPQRPDRSLQPAGPPRRRWRDGRPVQPGDRRRARGRQVGHLSRPHADAGRRRLVRAGGDRRRDDGDEARPIAPRCLDRHAGRRGRLLARAEAPVRGATRRSRARARPGPGRCRPTSRAARSCACGWTAAR